MDLKEFLAEWNDSNDYVSAHTSGSTGQPKHIQLLKSDMLTSAKATNEFFGIDQHSVLGLPLSIDYIAGKMMAVRALAAKCQLVTINPSNDFDAVGTFDLFSIVPSQAECLLRHPEWAASFRNIIIGGAPLPQQLATQLCDMGYNAYCSYGMTETCSHVALAPISNEIKPYVALPGISFEIDERGCLVIIAPNFSFKRLVTNDIVSLVDNRSFFWRGRFDNVINTGGIKIFPEELEKEISGFVSYPFYIVGAPDPKWGTRIEMVVECGEEYKEKIQETLRKRLDHVKIPKNIYFVDTLPRTNTGKIKREIINLQNKTSKNRWYLTS
mgnify:FL=1